MRILMVNTYHYLRGGDSAYALGITAALERAGHEVIPFAMQGERNLPASTAESFTPELDYPRMQAQGGLGNAWKVASNSIYNRNARRRIGRLLDAHPVDVVHFHSIMHHLTASIVLECRRRKLPAVWTLHDAKAACPTTRFLREGKVCHACAGGRFHNALRYRCKRGSRAASAVVTLELYLHRLWKIYERTEVLITPSRYLRDALVEAGLPPENFTVVPNYVRIEEFPEPAEPGDYGLYVGRLSPEKGLEVLLEAARSQPGLPLRIAGSGELEASLKERCREWGLSQVRFEGHVGRERLIELLAGARCLILPSTCEENCPISILEAFAAGRAVLASRNGGLPELVEDGISGRLVSPGDVSAWAEALTEVHRNPREWGEMGQRARALARSRFSEASHLETLMGLYRKAIALRRGN